MYLKGTKFIVESGVKGLKAGNVDIWNAILSSKYYFHFGNPILQSLHPVDNKKYKKQQFTISDCYIMIEGSIDKIKLPKVITGNEEKEFMIPELKQLFLASIPEVIEAIVVGDKKEAYLKNVIEKNPEIIFHIYDNIFSISYPNIKLTDIMSMKRIKKEDVLIICSLE